MIDLGIKRRNGGALLFALVLSCVLVLQSTLGAFAAGGMRPGPQRDIFGNLLCLSEGGHHSRSTDHGAVPDCCTFACLSGAIASAPPPQHGLKLPVQLSSAVRHGYAAPSVLAVKEASSHRPRGPPVLA